jgi:hypothetical protein
MALERLPHRARAGVPQLVVALSNDLRMIAECCTNSPAHPRLLQGSNAYAVLPLHLSFHIAFQAIETDHSLCNKAIRVNPKELLRLLVNTLQPCTFRQPS